MSCPTCDHTTQGLGNDYFWCPRCGSVIDRRRENSGVDDPMLVERVRILVRMIPEFKAMLQELGIYEAIYLPEDRPK